MGSMHLRDRKLKTCKKLACMQTMGSGVVRALRASPFCGLARPAGRGPARAGPYSVGPTGFGIHITMSMCIIQCHIKGG